MSGSTSASDGAIEEDITGEDVAPVDQKGEMTGRMARRRQAADV